MHELGLVVEVIRQVRQAAKQAGEAKVEAIVLQIGEISSVIPHFVRECYPAVVDGTEFENTRLEIEEIKARGQCRSCGLRFYLMPTEGICPHCKKRQPLRILQGREFMIKEIVVDDGEEEAAPPPHRSARRAENRPHHSASERREEGQKGGHYGS